MFNSAEKNECLKRISDENILKLLESPQHSPISPQPSPISSPPPFPLPPLPQPESHVIEKLQPVWERITKEINQQVKNQQLSSIQSSSSPPSPIEDNNVLPSDPSSSSSSSSSSNRIEEKLSTNDITEKLKQNDKSLRDLKKASKHPPRSSSSSSSSLNSSSSSPTVPSDDEEDLRFHTNSGDGYYYDDDDDEYEFSEESQTSSSSSSVSSSESESEPELTDDDIIEEEEKLATSMEEYNKLQENEKLIEYALLDPEFLNTDHHQNWIKFVRIFYLISSLLSLYLNHFLKDHYEAAEMEFKASVGTLASKLKEESRLRTLLEKCRSRIVPIPLNGSFSLSQLD
jgi:hypothetical protein